MILFYSKMKYLETSSFLAGLVVLSAIAWIVAFAGSIAASQSINYFPKFTWWGLVFELIIVIAIPIAVFTAQLQAYRPFLLCCTAIAFIYTSNSVNNLVYYSNSSTAAASAGFIILSIGNFIWLFYLGTDDLTPLPNNRSVSLSNKQTMTQSTTNLNSQQNEIRGMENIELSTTGSVDSINDSYPVLVKGLYDYNASPDDANELTFKKGEMLRVENTIGNWWLGRNSRGEVGMCPSNYLEIV